MTTSLLALAAGRLGYLADVQTVLASNMANIDTPGFQPLQVVSFSDYLNGANAGMPMLQNNPADLPAPTLAPIAASVTSAPGEHSPDGNAVSLDKQLEQVSQNEANQQLAANVYQAYMGMFKTALGSAAA